MRAHEKIKYVFELVAIIGGLIGVFFLVAQYKEMVRATNATLDAADVAREQMKEMQRQSRDTEAQAAPNIKVEWMDTKTTADTSYNTNKSEDYYKVTIRLKNYGYSPAFDIEFKMDYVQDGETNTGWTPAPSYLPFGTMEFPNLAAQETRENIILIDLTSPNSWSKANPRYEYLVRVRYSDIYNRRWITVVQGEYRGSENRRSSQTFTHLELNEDESSKIANKKK